MLEVWRLHMPWYASSVLLLDLLRESQLCQCKGSSYATSNDATVRLRLKMINARQCNIYGNMWNALDFETSPRYFNLYTLHGDLDHLHRVLRTVPGVSGHFGDLLDQIISLHHLAKDWMCWWGTAIEPVQEAVVVHIDEELWAARVGCPGIRHGQSAWLISQLRCELILDVATCIAEGLAMRKLRRMEAG